jgi:hypothetical protein
MVKTMSHERIEALEKQIADLKKRWPAHSVPVAMMEQLDELEEELSREIVMHPLTILAFRL